MILIAVVVFSTHKIPRIPSPWKEVIVKTAPTTTRPRKSPHALQPYSNNGDTNWKSTSPPVHLLTMILFVIATPKIILTVP